MQDLLDIHAECSDIHLFIVVTFNNNSRVMIMATVKVHSHMMIIFNSHMMIYAIIALLELKSCICHCVLALCGANVQAFILDKQREY